MSVEMKNAGAVYSAPALPSWGELLALVNAGPVGSYVRYGA